MGDWESECQLTRLDYLDGKECLGVKLCILDSDCNMEKAIHAWFDKHEIRAVQVELDPDAKKQKEEDDEQTEKEVMNRMEFIVNYPGYKVFRQHHKSFPCSIQLLPEELAEMVKMTHQTPMLPNKPLASLIPSSLLDLLKPYQIEGVEYVLKRSGRGMIADEMGLGKTLQGIVATLALSKHTWDQRQRPENKKKEKNEEEQVVSSTLKRRKLEDGSSVAIDENKEQKEKEQTDKEGWKYGAHMVICPGSLRDNWATKELQKWVPELLDSEIAIIKTAKDLTKYLQLPLVAPPVVLIPQEHVKKLKNKRKHAPPKNSDPDAKPKKVKRQQPVSISSIRYWIISYGLLVQQTVLKQIQTHLVPRMTTLILDECQQVKNEDAIRTQNISLLAKQIPFVILLSGTAAIKSKEMFAPLQLLQPLIFREFWIHPKGMPEYAKTRDQIRPLIPRHFRHSYALRWCAPYKRRTYGKHFAWDFEGSCRTKELHEIARYWGMIRRRKTILGDQLPCKTRERLLINTTPEELDKIAKIRDKIASLSDRPEEKKVWLQSMYHDMPRLKSGFVEKFFSEDFGTWLHPEIVQQWPDSAKQKFMTTHRLASVDDLHDFLKGLDKAKHKKVLLFAYHREMVTRMKEVLIHTMNMKENTHFIAIEGDTPMTDRQPRVDIFQKSETCNLAVLSLRAAGVGLNFCNASLVIFMELDYSPSWLLQAEDRAHRLGCKTPVTCLYVMVRGSLEMGIWKSLERKEHIGGELADGVARSFESSLTMQWNEEEEEGENQENNDK